MTLEEHIEILDGELNFDFNQRRILKEALDQAEGWINQFPSAITALRILEGDLKAMDQHNREKMDLLVDLMIEKRENDKMGCKIRKEGQ